MAQLGRIFDQDSATIAACSLAREQYERIAAIGADDPLPDDIVNAMQVRLMRWQRDRFGGDQLDERMALGIIEEQIETFDAEEPDQTEDALDGLGDTMVYAGQLAIANRLALSPILDLARVFTRRGDIRLIRSPGVLAQVVLKGAQKIRGMADRDLYRLRLVGALAMCIGHAIDHVEILHPQTAPVLPGKVYEIVGGEVLQRAQGHDAIPAKVTPEVSIAIDHGKPYGDASAITVIAADENGRARIVERKAYTPEEQGEVLAAVLDGIDEQADRMARAKAVHEQAIADRIALDHTQPHTFDLSDASGKPSE